MESGKPDKSLISGSTTLLLMQLLSEKEMYGYEMIETLKARSQNVFELKAGTLYPLLHGLEEKRFVESCERETGGKVRKYYRITGSGLKYLGQKKKEWETYQAAGVRVLGGPAYDCI